MLENFLTYINEKSLFAPTDKILLAVSGGMDSVVMTHLFLKAKLDFAVAHCNFGLRGEESEADEQFTKKLAKKYKVPFFVEQFDTQAFADREKISVQMAARVLRYEWFETVRRAGGFDYIAAAHHLNDTLETVLLNLAKGTGIAGLHGIQPKNGRIVRPILFADREEIYAYVVENQLAWREDSSNQSSHYQRNLIRNEVVPLLKTINPNLENTIERTADRVLAIEKILFSEIERLQTQICRQENDVHFIDFGRLQAEIEPVAKLEYLLKPFHFTHTQTRDIWQVLAAEPGRHFDSPTHRLVKDRTDLVLTPKPLHDFIPATIDAAHENFANEILSLEMHKLPAADFKIPTSPKIAALDYGLLKFPLKIRIWRQGDKFSPLGMEQKKKLSDFLIDAKVPQNIKERTHVLLSGDDIVWISGMRIDNRFKITDKTETVYRVTMH